jgi:hypothetical protein
VTEAAAPTLEAAAPAVSVIDQGGESGEPSFNDVIDSLVKELPADATSEQLEDGAEKPPAEEKKPETEEEVDEEDGKDDEVDDRRKKALSKDGKLDEEKLSSAFARLRDQERRAKARAQSIDSDKQAILTARAEYDERVNEFKSKYEPLLELATKNPVQYLLKAGWTKQDIADFIVNDEKLPPERLIAEADQRMKTQVEDLDRRQREFEQNQAKEKTQSKAREYENLVDSQVRAMAPKFSLTLKMATVDAGEGGDPLSVMHKAVLNYISSDYKRRVEAGEQNVKALAPRQALEYFESRLERQRAALADEVPGQAGAGKTAAQPGAGQPRPLTNDSSSERSAPLPQSGGEEQDEAVRQKAFDKLLADAERGVFPDE